MLVILVVTVPCGSNAPLSNKRAVQIARNMVAERWLEMARWMERRSDETAQESRDRVCPTVNSDEDVASVEKVLRQAPVRQQVDAAVPSPAVWTVEKVDDVSHRSRSIMAVWTR